MQHILDDGLWTNFSCSSRPWLNAMCGLIVGLIVCFSIQLKGKRLQPEPEHQRRETILWMRIMAVFVLMLLSIIPALARTTTLIFFEENELVLTGCWRGRPYEERTPLNRVESYYVEDGKRNERRALYLQWPHQKDIVRIELEGSQYLENLALIAPKAIEKYLRKRQADGRPIPDQLRAVAENLKKS